MDTLLVYGYNLYKTIKNWYYKMDTISYFMVAEDGEQLPIFTNTYKVILGFVTVYNKNNEFQYKFSSNFNINPIDIPTNKLLYISFTGDEINYNLNPKEFSIVGNTLFSPLFNVWLCHKLNISTIDNKCIIDDNANVHCIKTIHFDKNITKFEKT